MTRFTQTRLESQNNQTNIAVINPAVAPTRPSSPKIPLNIALGLIVGTVLAIGLALIAELRNRIVRCEEDIVEALDVPVIGHLSVKAGRRAFRSIERSRLAGPGPAATG
jgi:capsular polysaccharide biosynthesis protein